MQDPYSQRILRLNPAPNHVIIGKILRIYGILQEFYINKISYVYCLGPSRKSFNVHLLDYRCNGICMSYQQKLMLL